MTPPAAPRRREATASGPKAAGPGRAEPAGLSNATAASASTGTHSGHAWHAGHRLSARHHAGLLLQAGVAEHPLVVAGAPLVNHDRHVLALADDAEHAAWPGHHAGAALKRAAGDAAAGDATAPNPASARTRAPDAEPHRRHRAADPGAGSRRLGSAWLRHAGLRLLPWLVRTCEERLELAILRHRILELLAQVSALNEHVDVGRQRPGVFPRKQGDSARVLFSAEHELGFPLAACLEAPHRKHRAHDHGHHREADEQRSHRISPFSALTP